MSDKNEGSSDEKQDKPETSTERKDIPVNRGKTFSGRGVEKKG